MRPYQYGSSFELPLPGNGARNLNPPLRSAAYIAPDLGIQQWTPENCFETRHSERIASHKFIQSSVALRLLCQSMIHSDPAIAQWTWSNSHILISMHVSPSASEICSQHILLQGILTVSVPSGGRSLDSDLKIQSNINRGSWNEITTIPMNLEWISTLSSIDYGIFIPSFAAHLKVLHSHNCFGP